MASLDSKARLARKIDAFEREERRILSGEFSGDPAVNVCEWDDLASAVNVAIASGWSETDDVVLRGRRTLLRVTKLLMASILLDSKASLAREIDAFEREERRILSGEIAGDPLGNVCEWDNLASAVNIAISSGWSETDDVVLRGRKALMRVQDEPFALSVALASSADSAGLRRCPLVQTPLKLVSRLSELCQLCQTDVLVDVGAGDGRVVVQAAASSGCRSIGIEISRLSLEMCRDRLQEASRDDALSPSSATPLLNRVEFLRLDFADSTKLQPILRKATVIFLYLMPDNLDLLSPLLEAELKRGATVVSLLHSIPALEPRVTDDGQFLLYKRRWEE